MKQETYNKRKEEIDLDRSSKLKELSKQEEARNHKKLKPHFEQEARAIDLLMRIKSKEEKVTNYY